MFASIVLMERAALDEGPSFAEMPQRECAVSEAKITLTAQDRHCVRVRVRHAAAWQPARGRRAVKGTLEAIGVTLSVGYFAELIKSSIEAGDHLANLNKVTDLSVEELSGLQLLAKQSGTDIDGLAKAVSRMQVEIGKAPDKFRELGITATTGTGALKQFSDIFALLPDINQRNALAQAVFQRSWQEMAPILALGSARIQEVVDKGAQLSDDDRAGSGVRGVEPQSRRAHQHARVPEPAGANPAAASDVAGGNVRRIAERNEGGRRGVPSAR
jgi:hypothetical protein